MPDGIIGTATAAVVTGGIVGAAALVRCEIIGAPATADVTGGIVGALALMRCGIVGAAALVRCEIVGAPATADVTGGIVGALALMWCGIVGTASMTDVTGRIISTATGNDDGAAVGEGRGHGRNGQCGEGCKGKSSSKGGKAHGRLRVGRGTGLGISGKFSHRAR